MDARYTIVENKDHTIISGTPLDEVDLHPCQWAMISSCRRDDVGGNGFRLDCQIADVHIMRDSDDLNAALLRAVERACAEHCKYLG